MGLLIYCVKVTSKQYIEFNINCLTTTILVGCYKMRVPRKITNYFLECIDIHAIVIFLLVFGLTLLITNDTDTYIGRYSNTILSSIFGIPLLFAPAFALLCSILGTHTTNWKGTILVSILTYSIIAAIIYYLFGYVFVSK